MPWLGFFKKSKIKEEHIPQDELGVRPIPAIGIDLGTTNSSVSYVHNGKVEIVKNDKSKDTTPSVVHFGKSEIVVGEVALMQRRINPSLRTVSNIKRLIGRKHDSNFVQTRRWDFQVVSSNGRACAKIGEKIHTPEEISSYILKYMKDIATKKFLGAPTDAVITVPANFTNAQREATVEAAKLAGLNVLQIINEPTAAAIAFNAQNEDRDRKRCVLVFDLGGGTFDVTIVEIEGWKPPRVLATGGSTELGGTDFDARIYEQAIYDYYDLGIQVPDQEGPDWALMENCENAKIALTELDYALVNNTRFPRASFDLKYKAFVELCEHHFADALRITKDVMVRAGLDRSQIEEILLVGGSTKIRRIREKLAENFPKAKIRDDIDPMLAVAEGAARLADFLRKKQNVSEDSSDDSSSFISFNDVAPFNLGMRLAGDKYKKLVERNTPIPFTTYALCDNANDNDTVLKIEILEGESAQASKNDLLAKVEIEVTPKPARKNNIKVLVSVDNSGILSVRAIDLDTNKEASVTVTAM